MKKYGWEWKTEEGLKSWREILFSIISARGIIGGSQNFVILAEQLIQQENCFPDSFVILATLGSIYSSASVNAAKDISLSNDLLMKAQKAVDMASKYIIDNHVRDPEETDDLINEDSLTRYYETICLIGFAKYRQSDFKEVKYLQDIKPYYLKALSINPDDPVMGVIGKHLNMNDRDARTASAESDSLSSQKSNSSGSLWTLLIIGIFIIGGLWMCSEHGKKQIIIDQEKQQQVSRSAKETTVVATKSYTPVSSVREIGRDGRFIAYDDGTVLDTQTNLMWAAKDNGSDINWVHAKSYCDNYRGGGYTNWRMPTLDELYELHDETKTYKINCGGFDDDVKLTKLVSLSCVNLWTSETRGSDAAYLGFTSDSYGWWPRSKDADFRVLPVRSGK